MLKTLSIAAAALWATQALAGSFPSPTLYPSFSNPHGRGTFTTFTVSGATGTSPYQINASGVIVGSYGYGDEKGNGFLRATDGEITIIADPNAGYKRRHGTTATAINDAGDVAGDYTQGKPNQAHGYLRQADGTFISFDPPNSINTIVLAINNTGTIAGEYEDGDSFKERGFVRAPDGTLTTFSVPGESNAPVCGTDVSAMNAAGTVTGTYCSSKTNQRAYVRTADGTITKFDVHDAKYISVSAINSSGTVAGTYTNQAGWFVGFRRDPSGTITTFKERAAGANEQTIVTGLDDAGDVIGACSPKDGSTQHAFIRSPAGAFTKFHVDGSQVTYPVSINASGQITGFYSTGTTNAGFVWNN